MAPDKPTQDDHRGERDRTGGVAPAREAAHPTKVTVEELVAKGRTLADRVESAVRRVAAKLGRRSG